MINLLLEQLLNMAYNHDYYAFMLCLLILIQIDIFPARF